MNFSSLKSQLISYKQEYYKIILLLVIFLLVRIIMGYYFYKAKENYPAYRNNNFNVFGLNIPRNLDFCGENIPINDYAIKENLDAEFFSNRYWKSSASFFFGKAQKWFPYIEPILKREGVPDDFKYVAVIESHLTNATSPMGAAGFWQLVPGTAVNYGLIVNNNVDERLDVEKSTTAACKLIKEAFRIFKNWTLAAAAYNLGIGGIQNELTKQKSNNYFDLMLNKETGSFVYRILAYKTLFANPEHFGIQKRTLKYFNKIPVKIFKVDSSITDLKYFAKTINSNVQIIKLFNPWLLGDKLINTDKHIFEFKIPKKNNGDYSAYYNDLLVKDESDSLNKKVTVDSLVSVQNIIHTVGEKENLKEIAEFYEVSESNLKEWNNIKDTLALKPGTKLNINIKKK